MERLSLWCRNLNTMTKADRQRLETFEMRVWWRMEKVNWVRKVTNVEVLQKEEENSSILNTAKQQKTQTEHIVRHESLLRDTLEGRMLGKATRGRKRPTMLSDVSSKTYEDLKRKAGDRNG